MYKICTKRIASLLLMISFLVGCANTTQNTTPIPTTDATQTTPPVISTYWPTEGWRSTTPEKQGMDSSILVAMLESIREEQYNIHSLSIIRNGFLVLDVYYFPFNQNLKHIIHSCTKSIVSALVGIAIDQGFIDGIDQSILDFFPDKIAGDPKAGKADIRIEDLLTMSSGLDCRDSYLYNWQGLNEMRASDDWVQHILNLQMADQPGARFEYCNGSSYLLAAILQQASGITALEFASQYLFQPLGITDFDWPASPQGINIGWGELRLRPLDMAKIGYLYLNQGRWDDEQILAADWVQESTSAQIPAGTLAESYGYQWWVDKNDYVMALGYAGQTIFVLPEENMVVVFTSGLADNDFFIPERLLNEYIRPAVISSNPLPESQPAVAHLNKLLKEFQEPAYPKQIAALPDQALEISGDTFVFEEGSPFKEFNLTFDEDTARFHLTWTKTIEVDIGMDDVYRLTDIAGYLRAYKGFWLDDHTFHIDYQVVGYSENGVWEIDFTGDQALARFQEETTGTSEVMYAYRQDDE